MSETVLKHELEQEPEEWRVVLQWIERIDVALDRGTLSLSAEQVALHAARAGLVPAGLSEYEIAGEWLADIRDVLSALWTRRWHGGRRRSVREVAAWTLAAMARRWWHRLPTPEDNAVTGDCPERAFILAALALYGIGEEANGAA